MTPPLTDEELAELAEQYGDQSPRALGRKCHVCGCGEWALEAVGRGRCTWRCRAAKDSLHAKGDRDEKWKHYGDSTVETRTHDDRVGRALAELRHHRSRLSAEDVEALRWARECIVRGLKRDSCYDADGNPPPGFTMISRALAVLERLCGGKEGV